MRIQRLRLLTKELEKLQAFYTRILELPLLESSKDAFTVSVGASCLTFELTEHADEVPFYHFAFDIPENKMDEAIIWLRSKAVALNLLPNHSYKAYFHTWDATSIYFDDPAGNIVEFIARHSLNNEIDISFTSSTFVNISEIGLVVNDVTRTKTLMKNNLGLDGYKDSDPSFAAVGDEDGLLIVSAPKRVWLGSEKKAAVFRTEVTIEGTDKGTGTIDLDPYPYKIIVN
ncbi:VOC family protein [Paenibacillus montanisoli]|uniref:Ring-cleaving dioxygenase n=1 Tax=Paenibacillus montanisoli TaxID=2081970 RepID=A0A328U3W8_9BACL|nr:VOC family protein [Paenibacillus montanisoli]RAP76151.1 ring-cleaving dioxygenase [Paenibacillus montanisoli]